MNPFAIFFISVVVYDVNVNSLDSANIYTNDIRVTDVNDCILISRIFQI